MEGLPVVSGFVMAMRAVPLAEKERPWRHTVLNMRRTGSFGQCRQA
jgi:hypothetical protein